MDSTWCIMYDASGFILMQNVSIVFRLHVSSNETMKTAYIIVYIQPYIFAIIKMQGYMHAWFSWTSHTLLIYSKSCVLLILQAFYSEIETYWNTTSMTIIWFWKYGIDLRKFRIILIAVTPAWFECMLLIFRWV